MRVLFALPALAVLVAAAADAVAQAKSSVSTQANARGPKAIGHFDDWTAATNAEAGKNVCYAFTRVQSSSPMLPGRSGVVLTVAQRPGGRDAVAISAGMTYPVNADVKVLVEQTSLDFYTAQSSAYARDGRAAVEAFQKAARLIARSPAPKGATVSDTFSLRGFKGAYAAINKACPGK